MKMLNIITAIALGLNATANAVTQSGSPNHYVIAIGPGLSKEKGAEVLKQSFDLLLNRAQAGDRVEFYDAPKLTKLADVVVPAGSARERANSQEFAAKFGALKKFLAEPTVDSPQLAGQLRVPQLLDTLAKTCEPSQRAVVILVGAPLFITTYPKEMAFNMEGSLTPGDGMVACSSLRSLFGTEERKGQLNGVVIHWLTPIDTWATSEMHRSAVLRFWTVFTGEQGAVLATFSSDTEAVFDRAVRGENRALVSVKIDPNDLGLIMRPPPAFKRETISAPPPVRAAIAAKPASETPLPAPPPLTPALPITNAAAPSVVPPPAPEVTPSTRVEASLIATKPEPPAKPAEETVAMSVPLEIPKPARGNIGIAAVWSAEPGTDIDLWVAAKPGMPEAYWNEPRVSRVRYFRDIRTAQPMNENAQWSALWEYAEVERAELIEPTVWLNVYAAKGPVKGIVRVQFDGRVVDRPFFFNVTRGNRGRDANLAARSRSPYWQQIPLADMFQNTFPGQNANMGSR